MAVLDIFTAPDPRLQAESGEEVARCIDGTNTHRRYVRNTHATDNGIGLVHPLRSVVRSREEVTDIYRRDQPLTWWTR